MAVLAATSSAAGQILRAVTRLVALRPAAKPLHPEGAVVSGTLTRRGSQPPSGVAWLDGTGTDEVLVRQSRAVGFPDVLPDVFGLALRIPVTDDTHGDLLLATTGRGRWTRFLLTPRRSPYRPVGTLLPYRTSAGGVVLTAQYRDRTTLELAWAVGAGPWRPFAELRLHAPTDGPDQPVSFDPVLNRLPGLETYEWVRRMREPSYRTARSSRSGA